MRWGSSSRQLSLPPLYSIAVDALRSGKVPLQHLRTKALSLWRTDEWSTPFRPLQLEILPGGSCRTPRKLHFSFSILPCPVFYEVSSQFKQRHAHIHARASPCASADANWIEHPAAANAIRAWIRRWRASRDRSRPYVASFPYS
jgi:hypothetical protein